MPIVLAPTDPTPTPINQSVIDAVERWLRYLDGSTGALPDDIDADRSLFLNPPDGFGLIRQRAEDHVRVLDRYVREPDPHGAGYQRPSGRLTRSQLQRQLDDGTLVINTCRDLIRLCLN